MRFADVDPGDGRADRLDDARALVSADHRHPHRRVALLHMVVGVAQAGRVELDQDLVGLRVIELELSDLPGLAGFPGRPRLALSCPGEPLSWVVRTAVRARRRTSSLPASRTCAARRGRVTMLIRRVRGVNTAGTVVPAAFAGPQPRAAEPVWWAQVRASYPPWRGSSAPGRLEP